MIKAPCQFVSYLRVSTTRQGESGLGLEAQRTAVEAHVRTVSGTVIAELVEVESGKKSSRPILADALALCRRTGAVLIIAKLDRLARNVAFVSSLMESRTEFLACDLPFANRLMLHIMAAFAEHEREQIAARTKAALAAAKQRGVKLGGHGAVLAVQRKAEAQARAEELRRALEPVAGRTLVDTASHLNREGIATLYGAAWTPTTVRRVLIRLGLHEGRNSSPQPTPGPYRPVPAADLT